jgi:hypothetical protein
MAFSLGNMARPLKTILCALLLSACGISSDAFVGSDDSAAVTGSALSGAVDIGSTLQATANVNLRAGPSTSYSIREVVANGDTVVTINRTTPSGAFYNVNYAGRDGWVHGAYLRFVSGPGDTGSGGGDPGAGGGDSGAGGGGSTADCGSVGSTYTCTADGSARQRCDSGQLVSESCDQGCLREPSGTDAQCLGGSYALVCGGSYGTQKSTTGNYDLTAFGCWKDASGGVHTDPGDNCIPTCLSQAHSSGLCAAGSSGASCEESVTWYTADAARFGCLARLKITNPANGKSVIAVALDYGPSCSVEHSVSSPVLDASGRIDRYLFGADQGAVDRAKVHVVEVDPSTPLGPVP